MSFHQPVSSESQRGLTWNSHTGMSPCTGGGGGVGGAVKPGGSLTTAVTTSSTQELEQVPLEVLYCYILMIDASENLVKTDWTSKTETHR